MLDEELNTIDVLNFYQSPERLRPILILLAAMLTKQIIQRFYAGVQ